MDKSKLMELGRKYNAEIYRTPTGRYSVALVDGKKLDELYAELVALNCWAFRAHRNIVLVNLSKHYWDDVITGA